jgi:hypothetical protein
MTKNNLNPDSTWKFADYYIIFTSFWHATHRGANTTKVY